MKKVAYFTNIAPHYREELWLTIAKNLNLELHFYFGLSKAIQNIDFNSNQDWINYREQAHEVKNVRYRGRLIYQRKVIRELLFKKWDCIILLGDANLISNWILSIVARIKKTPVVFWGHGLYGNETGIRKLIRKRFYALSNINLVYGNWAKNQMVKEGFKPDKIKVIYNSVNYEKSKALRANSLDPTYFKQYFKNDFPVLIFIGRLTKIKKLDLLIKSVNILIEKDFHVNLMIVGTGESKKELENLANKSKADIFFYGSCYDEKEISKLVANADLCVSPGNVGLTSIHSMSYGTPVCTHDDFANQMPEYEAIIEGKTGCFFCADKHNLDEVIFNWLANVSDRNAIRQKCYSLIDRTFNPYNQTRIMKSAIEETIGKKNISKS
jgi:glycosyltransferase involved in cell wall biosynthesis